MLHSRKKITATQKGGWGERGTFYIQIHVPYSNYLQQYQYIHTWIGEDLVQFSLVMNFQHDGLHLHQIYNMYPKLVYKTNFGPSKFYYPPPLFFVDVYKPAFGWASLNSLYPQIELVFPGLASEDEIPRSPRTMVKKTIPLKHIIL